MTASTRFCTPVFLFAALTASVGGATAAPKAYISRCCDSGSSLVLLNTATQTQTSRALLGHSATAPTISADGKTAYFLDLGAGSLLIYDLTASKLSASVYLGVAPGNLLQAASNQMIALTPDGSRAYVALPALVGQVGVVDLVANQLITRVKVSSFPTSAVVLSKDGKTVYAPSQDICIDDCVQASLAVIDTATNKVTAQLYSDYGSSSALLSPDGSRLYVAEDGAVGYYDTASNTYLGSILISFSGFSFIQGGLAMKPDGSQLYVVAGSVPGITVIDTQTETVVSTISLPSGAVTLAITPDGTQMYALDGGSGISVVDTPTNTVATSFTLPEAVDGIAFGLSGKKALLTDSLPATLALANPATNKLSNVIFGPADPGAVAVSPDNTTVYVAGENGIGVVDAATHKQTRLIPVEYQPQAIAISTDGSTALLATFDQTAAREISAVVVDLASGNTLAKISNQGLGSAAAISPDGKTGYVGDFESMIVIDLTTFSVTREVKYGIGNSAVGLLLSADGSQLYVSVAGLGTLFIYQTAPFEAIGSIGTGANTGVNIQMALTAGGKTLLIPDYNGHQLVFVDLPTSAVTNKVPVSGDPLAVAITPDGSAAWTAGGQASLSKTVTVVDVASHAITATVNIGGTAAGIAFVP